MLRARFILLLSLFLTLMVACSDEAPADNPPVAEVVATAAPTATDTPAPTPSATLTPTPTFTPTPTPTETPTPTPTHTPTVIPSPTPSPTPEGYFRNDAAGISLTLPDAWEVVNEEEGSIELLDNRNGFFVLFDGSEDFNQLSSQAIIQVLVAALGDEFAEVEPLEEIAFEGGISGERAVFTDNQGVGMQVLIVRDGSRTLLSIAIGELPAISPLADSLQALYDSVAFLPPSIYGLSVEETLLEPGSDPVASELDPALQAGSAGGYVGLLYSGLVRFSPELQIEGDLAESWSLSPDGTTYTFTLRPDLAFADGRPLTAEDVKYSWERLTDPDTGSETAGTYLGDILGVDAKLAGDATEIAGVEVVDPRTLRVALDGPKPYFLAKLTYPTSYVVDREDVESGDDDWMYDPNATGPYRVREYLPGEAIIFERNEHYHTPANIPYVLFRFNLFGSPLSLYEAGEIDFLGLSLEDARLIREPDHPLNDQLYSATSLCTNVVQLNNARPPLDDLNVRRALALATDKRALLEIFGDDISPTADTLLPPGMPGFSTDGGNGGNGGYDPDAARAALAASSYAGDVPPIVFSTFGRGDAESEYVQALGEMWREELGIEFTIEYFDPENYTVAARELDSNAVVWGWCADYPDPENFLDLLFHSDSELNLAEYANPEVDALLEEARTEVESGRRLDLYHEIELLLMADGAFIPISHSLDFLLVAPRVQNFVMPPLGVPQTHRLDLAGPPGE